MGRPRRERNECAFPHKKKYTKAQVRDAIWGLRRKGQRGLTYYRCPRKGHWHIGGRGT